VILAAISAVCISGIVFPFQLYPLFTIRFFALIQFQPSMTIFDHSYHLTLHFLHRVLFAGSHSFPATIRTLFISSLSFRGFSAENHYSFLVI
jgi:hypothetical protein